MDLVQFSRILKIVQNTHKIFCCVRKIWIYEGFRIAARTSVLVPQMVYRANLGARLRPPVFVA